MRAERYLPRVTAVWRSPGGYFGRQPLHLVLKPANIAIFNENIINTEKEKLR